MTPDNRTEFEKNILNKERKTFAGAAGFNEFRHREIVRPEASFAQRRAKLRAILGQYDVLAQYNCVTSKVCRFLGGNLDQVRNMMADCPLGVFVERRRIPYRTAARQRTETCVQMVIAVLDQFHREDQAVQKLCELVVRTNIRPETITAE